MRIFGHPLHAILVAFPLGLLTLTPLWDSLECIGLTGAHFAAYFGELAGLTLGTLAVVTGAIDFVRIPKSAGAEKVALWHASAAVTSLCIFAVALALRSKDHTATPPVIALEALGSFALGLTGWCGGHLVFHHRVAVRE